MAVNSAALDQLDLQSAADELGVHYQTAYRWVRTGLLRAEMVGGRYVVSRDDLVSFGRSQRKPKAPPAPKPSRLDHAAERMYAALVAGDETAAAKIVRKLADEGAPTVDLIQLVLVPPLHQIGQGWSDGDVAISTEHRASSIVERLLGELSPNPRGRRRGVAAVVAVSGDRHTLPTTMAAVALRADNWHVHHLGADLPPEEIDQFCAQNDVSLAVITATTPGTRQLADATASSLNSGGIPTIVGGPGKTLTELIELARDKGRTR